MPPVGPSMDVTLSLAWMEDIKVRAIARMGELTEALPQAEPGGAVDGKRGGGSTARGVGQSN